MIKIKNSNIEQAKYIGSCVDVDKNNNKQVCNFFPDASELSRVIENNTNISQISKSEFEKCVDTSSGPKKATKGELEYYFVSIGKYKINEAALFYIYNLDQDIHYFFKR